MMNKLKKQLFLLKTCLCVNNKLKGDNLSIYQKASIYQAHQKRKRTTKVIIDMPNYFFLSVFTFF